MEMTVRGLWTMIHGMGFGALYLMACSGALVELYRRYCSPLGPEIKEKDEKFLRIYLTAMAVLAWLTVLTGAYIIYPWYRAVPPPGTVSLTEFPQRLLLSNSSTAAWALHRHGMERVRCLARAHLHHHGRGGLFPISPQPSHPP